MVGLSYLVCLINEHCCKNGRKIFTARKNDHRACEINCLKQKHEQKYETTYFETQKMRLMVVSVVRNEVKLNPLNHEVIISQIHQVHKFFFFLLLCKYKNPLSRAVF